MKKWMVNNKWTLMGISFGAISGFLYWNFIGCSNGTCAITSDPFKSSAYFALMGGLLFSMFKKDNANQTKPNSNDSSES